jgi:flotillin
MSHNAADEGLAILVFIALFGLLGVFAAFAVLVPQFLHICMPNEILIFSGRKHRLADGAEVGFKVLHGGRGFRWPLLETVSRMDVRLLPVELAVSNVYSKGGIPLTLQAIANVKVSTNPSLVNNAVERFLGASTDAIASVARQTLEGVLREVLSQLTPEEVNQDRLKFADTLMTHARDDFEKLGLELDVLKVQHVSDEQQYLANLGRARIAGMIRDAQNAENTANQAVAERQAGARQRAETARKQAEALILQKKNQVRAELAKLDAEAKSVENEAKVAAETARMVAEQELQAARAELAALRLQCDTVLPAEAARQAQEAQAAGDASPIVENGKAAAEALRLVAEQWRLAGPAGREIYVLQQLPALAEAAIGRVTQTEIEEAMVVEGDGGGGYAALAASHPMAVARVLRETALAVGVDLDALLSNSKTQAVRS